MSSIFITKKEKFLSDIINGIFPKTDVVDIFLAISIIRVMFSCLSYQGITGHLIAIQIIKDLIYEKQNEDNIRIA